MANHDPRSRARSGRTEALLGELEALVFAIQPDDIRETDLFRGLSLANVPEWVVESVFEEVVGSLVASVLLASSTVRFLRRSGAELDVVAGFMDGAADYLGRDSPGTFSETNRYWASFEQPDRFISDIADSRFPDLIGVMLILKLVSHFGSASPREFSEKCSYRSDASDLVPVALRNDSARLLRYVSLGENAWPSDIPILLWRSETDAFCHSKLLRSGQTWTKVDIGRPYPGYLYLSRGIKEGDSLRLPDPDILPAPVFFRRAREDPSDRGDQ